MALIRILDYKIGINDQFFFDTNIWLIIFAPIANSRKNEQRVYSNFLKELITRNVTIVINSLVISEFVNVILKNDFKNWKEKNKFYDKEYKRDFIKTDDYKNSVEFVNSLLDSILNLDNLIKVGDNLNAINFESVKINLKSIDLNDSYYIEWCKLKNYKIVTDDSDFAKISLGNLDVITF